MPRKTKMQFNASGRGGKKRIMTLEEIKAKYHPAITCGVPEEVTMAQDSALNSSGAYTLLQHSMSMLGSYAFPEFLGYGYLTGLTQHPLIRVGVEMISDEMTRAWGKVVSEGEDTKHPDNGFEYEENDTDQKVAELMTELKRYKIKELFHDCANLTSYFGGCLVYIDTGASSDELMNPLYLDPTTFPKNSIKGFKIIEPYNVAPSYYNTTNPLAEDYFKPRSWWIQGREVHASRFLYFAHNLPPTLLLPAYNFFGIPLAQIVLDPVMHFTESRECTARLLKKFSLTVFKTNMSGLLQGGGAEDINRRVDYMVQSRDNDGVETIDFETEDIVKLETPLSGLTDIVRQCMEIVAAYFGEPAVKLWGISPAGFNATGESDLQNHYDHVASQQEKLFRKPIDTILRLLQMNLHGEIDESITFDFEPIGKEDVAGIASVNKTKADTAIAYFDHGILSGEEIRSALSKDQQSGFSDIDPDAMPEQPDEGEGVGSLFNENANDISTKSNQNKDELTAEDGEFVDETHKLKPDKNGDLWITIQNRYRVKLPKGDEVSFKHGEMLMSPQLYGRVCDEINAKFGANVTRFKKDVHSIYVDGYFYRFKVREYSHYKFISRYKEDDSEYWRKGWEDVTPERSKKKKRV